MCGLGIVHAQPIQQDQSFGKRRAEDAQVGLYSLGCALLQIDAGVDL